MRIKLNESECELYRKRCTAIARINQTRPKTRVFEKASGSRTYGSDWPEPVILAPMYAVSQQTTQQCGGCLTDIIEETNVIVAQAKVDGEFSSTKALKFFCQRSCLILWCYGEDLTERNKRVAAVEFELATKIAELRQLYASSLEEAGRSRIVFCCTCGASESRDYRGRWRCDDCKEKAFRSTEYRYCKDCGERFVFTDSRIVQCAEHRRKKDELTTGKWRTAGGHLAFVRQVKRKPNGHAEHWLGTINGYGAVIWNPSGVAIDPDDARFTLIEQLVPTLQKRPPL